MNKNSLVTKNDFRHHALDLRKDQDDKDELSQKIQHRVEVLAEYQSAKQPLVYVSVRTEVRTIPLIRKRLELNLPIVVPYCQGDLLRLFCLSDESQLARGAFGILEPQIQLRQDASLHASIDDIDLAIVPGVAFDKKGKRIGYGKGYFDRLLADAKTGLTKVGLAFDCQLFDQLPTDKHDIAMDYVVTESQIVA